MKGVDYSVSLMQMISRLRDAVLMAHTGRQR